MVNSVDQNGGHTVGKEDKPKSEVVVRFVLLPLLGWTVSASVEVLKKKSLGRGDFSLLRMSRDLFSTHGKLREN